MAVSSVAHRVFVWYAPCMWFRQSMSLPWVTEKWLRQIVQCAKLASLLDAVSTGYLLWCGRMNFWQCVFVLDLGADAKSSQPSLILHFASFLNALAVEISNEQDVSFKPNNLYITRACCYVGIAETQLISAGSQKHEIVLLPFTISFSSFIKYWFYKG